MRCRSLTQKLCVDSIRSSEDISQDLRVGECSVVVTKLEKYKEILLVSLLNEVTNNQ